MTAPTTHQVVLEPPQRKMSEEGRYKFLYEVWQRLGRFNSNIPDLQGLTVSSKQLNTLTGIHTDDTVQEQIDTKAATANLKTMAYQDKEDVLITGGTIGNVSISGSTITIPAGATTLNIQLNGTLHTDTSTIGNVGIGEDTLLSFTLPPNTLNGDEEFIELTAWGTLAANANNKRLRLKLGATNLLDSGVVAANSGSWEIKATIIRIGGSAQKSIGNLFSDNATFGQDSNYVAVTEDLTTALDIFCTGEAVVNNDIVQEGLIIKWFNA